MARALLLLIIKAMAMMAMAIFDSACQLRSGTRVKSHSRLCGCVRARQPRCDTCEFFNLNKSIIVHPPPLHHPCIPTAPA